MFARAQEQPTLAMLAEQQEVKTAVGRKRARTAEEPSELPSRPTAKATRVPEGEAAAAQPPQDGKPSAKSKHRPAEASSKRPVKRLREVVEGTSSTHRDPRFDTMLGSFSDDKFKKRYSFLYDENLPDEQQELRKSLKKVKGAETQQSLKQQLKDVQRQIAEEQRRRASEKTAAEQKGQEREAVKAGKRPYFLKASERKRQALVQRFHELKSSGRLEKVMDKRRKKVAAKDHRLVPRGRRTAPT
ncbi:hypothetical protein WJX73_006577 [Symbiochloris irregularis]|uniref:rRNA biogenesis protein RRP36 n=1 Tax=Symbiochloris irregularis TaxID=706552 RepID=A0AAW1P673_9CHLO